MTFITSFLRREMITTIENDGFQAQTIGPEPTIAALDRRLTEAAGWLYQMHS
jgi:hypothetical protein